MAERSSSTIPIIVAVIGVAGTVSAALIANWDKVWGDRAAASTPAEQVADRNGAATSTANQDATAADIAAAKVPVAVDVSGMWVDSDGYEYAFEQKGNYYNFRQLKGGTQIGSGDGVLTGHSFTHRFTGVFGDGRCAGEITGGGNVSSGTCSSGGSTWDFKVVRAGSAKS